MTLRPALAVALTLSWAMLGSLAPGVQAGDCKGQRQVLREAPGFVTDGAGNYSVNGNCEWLIEGEWSGMWARPLTHLRPASSYPRPSQSPFWSRTFTVKCSQCGAALEGRYARWGSGTWAARAKGMRCAVVQAPSPMWR